jgi:hypothetical protein
MMYRFRREVAMAWFAMNVRKIFQTAPLRCEPSAGALFVSQVCHRDVAMYLLAIKSLARHIQPKMVFALDDTSLSQHDKEILRHHIHPIEILPVTTVANSRCPKGGCWERLLFISDKAPTSYVVQIDSDTLTLGVPKAVRKHIDDNLSFTLGEWRGQKIVSAREAACSVKDRVTNGSEHVQMISEANLDRLEFAKEAQYVRGSAGFAGFARASLSREEVERFSRSMARIIGNNKWSEWGSEQVTSNFVVANTDGAEVLPFPEYCFHSPEIDVEPATFVHFIGSYRFHGGRYARLARRVIEELPRS